MHGISAELPSIISDGIPKQLPHMIRRLPSTRPFAHAWNSRGNYEKGKVITEKITPEEIWTDRGFALGELGKYADALESFDEAVKINPDYTKAWYHEGFVLYSMGRFIDGIDSFDVAISLNPNDANMYYARGFGQFNAGQYTDAIASYDRAICHQPGFHRGAGESGNRASTKRIRYPDPSTRPWL